MNNQPKQQPSSSTPATTSLALAPNSAASASAHSMSGSEFQQALFQSMAASQGHGHTPSNSFVAQGPNQSQAQGHHGQSLPLSQMDLVQQLMGMNENNNKNSAPAAATAAPFAQNAQTVQNNNNNSNNNIVSQLVASLQAQQVQQQSQQQAQVQAAISRAFGPSSLGGGQQQQQQMQQPNNNNLLSQMQLAQAQGLLSGGNNNFLPSLGNVGNDMNTMLQMKRAAMMAGQDANMKKPRTDNASFQMNKFGSGNLLSSVPNLSNSLFPNSAVGIQGIINPNPAAAFGNSNEVDLQQKLASTRGAVIVPCRARGMPVDHNFKTAYFVIPDGIEHGDELVCSYPACRQAGVKFRYCVDCKVPVAKRNFRNRHRHGVPGGDGGSVSGEDDEEDNSGDEDDSKPEGEEDPSKGNVCMPASEGGDAAPNKEHVIVIPGGKPKKKKSVRVPCRARGMPMAHNFKTAHFIIPPNIQHGDELVCSFPPCRAAGAKFRYCLHCKVPVAKRNFRNRHKHGNLGEKKKAAVSLEKKDVDNEESEAKMEEDMKSEEKPEERRNSEEDSEDPEENEGDLKPSASPTGSTGASASNQTTVAISSNHDPQQVQQWVSLLDTKPDPSDKEAMAIWMMNLMQATGAMSSRASDAGASSDAGVSASGEPESKNHMQDQGASSDAGASAPGEPETKNEPLDQGASSDVGVSASGELESKNEPQDQDPSLSAEV